jgi:hypothetical protein
VQGLDSSTAPLRGSARNDDTRSMTLLRRWRALERLVRATDLHDEKLPRIRPVRRERVRDAGRDARDVARAKLETRRCRGGTSSQLARPP